MNRVVSQVEYADSHINISVLFSYSTRQLSFTINNRLVQYLLRVRWSGGIFAYKARARRGRSRETARSSLTDRSFSRDPFALSSLLFLFFLSFCLCLSLTHGRRESLVLQVGLKTVGGPRTRSRTLVSGPASCGRSDVARVLSQQALRTTLGPTRLLANFQANSRNVVRCVL